MSRVRGDEAKRMLWAEYTHCLLKMARDESIFLKRWMTHLSGNATNCPASIDRGGRADFWVRSLIGLDLVLLPFDFELFAEFFTFG